MTGIDEAGTGAGAEAKTPGGSRQAVCPNCGWPRPIVAFTGMCGECTVRERDPGNGETARAPGGRRTGNGEGSIG